MRVIKQAERAWNKVYDDIELPGQWKILDRSFSLLPNEVQTVIALTAQQYRQATLDQLELVHSIESLRKGDRIRIAYIHGETIDLTIGKIESGIIRSVSLTVVYSADQMRIYKIKPRVQPPNPINNPHIIDRHDGRAWVWNGIDSQYIRIGESVTKDCDDFDDWEPARSVADDA
jgi:hypothetical protein